MVLPASGTISMSQISVEMGQAATYSATIAWINSKAKVASNSLSGHYGKAYFQKNNAGNCNNGNCAQTYTSDCGNINCVNCWLYGNVQCVNCDTTSYLQANCNCYAGVGYQCSAVPVSYNCDCNCNC